MRKSAIHTISVICLSAALSGCAGREARNEEQAQRDNAVHQKQATESSKAAGLQAPAASTDLNAPTAATENPRATTLGMNARLDALEAKMSAMNDKLDATRAALDNFLSAHEPRATGTPGRAADTVGMPIATSPAPTDLEAGYVNDAAIQLYRKAEILLESEKYAEAAQIYAKFLEEYPDHPLAGSAQFHVGEARFKQGQWQAADREFQKVLTSYDRSTHVSDTLRLMAQAEDHLGKTTEAARHRQQLTSLFANSPSAAQMASAPTSEAPSANTAPVQQQAHDAPVETKPGLDGPPPTAPTAPVNNE